MRIPRKIVLSWKQSFVETIYATHNKSKAIRHALNDCVRTLDEDNVIGLNIGAGFSELHPAIINLDIVPNPNINCCARAENLPFASFSIDLIVSQETIEHVRDPYLAVAEMYRVSSDSGTVYCQLPFIIGYHPGPTDYWRFSKEGIVELFEHAGFLCEEVNIAVGPATGFYRIAVEFFALLFSLTIPKSYLLAKGLVALILYPIKLFDPLFMRSIHADRIAGGYYIVARKNQ